MRGFKSGRLNRDSLRRVCRRSRKSCLDFRRTKHSVSVQCIPDHSEHEVNTERFELINQAVLHTEGGWPKDVDHHEIEQVGHVCATLTLLQ